MKWIKLGWKKIKLSRKQRLLAALAGVAIVATLGFYLWGNQASAAEYMTARVEGGNLRNTVCYYCAGGQPGLRNYLRSLRRL